MALIETPWYDPAMALIYMNVSKEILMQNRADPSLTDFTMIGTCAATALGRRIQDRMGRENLHFDTVTLAVRVTHDMAADTSRVQITGTATYDRAVYLTDYARRLAFNTPD